MAKNNRVIEFDETKSSGNFMLSIKRGKFIKIPKNAMTDVWR